MCVDSCPLFKLIPKQKEVLVAEEGINDVVVVCSHVFFFVFVPVLLCVQQTETVWLHSCACVCVCFSRRGRDQIDCLTAPYVGRFDLHSCLDI